MTHSDVLFGVICTEQHIWEGPDSFSSIHGFMGGASPMQGLGGRLLHILAGAVPAHGLYAVARGRPHILTLLKLVLAALCALPRITGFVRMPNAHPCGSCYAEPRAVGAQDCVPAGCKGTGRWVQQHSSPPHCLGVCSLFLCPHCPLFIQCLRLRGLLVLLRGEIKYFDFVF